MLYPTLLMPAPISCINSDYLDVHTIYKCDTCFLFSFAFLQMQLTAALKIYLFLLKIVSTFFMITTFCKTNITSFCIHIACVFIALAFICLQIKPLSEILSFIMELRSLGVCPNPCSLLVHFINYLNIRPIVSLKERNIE